MKTYRIRKHFKLKTFNNSTITLKSMRHRSSENRMFELEVRYPNYMAVSPELTVKDLYKLHKSISQVLGSRANYTSVQRQHRACIRKKAKKMVKSMYTALSDLAGEGKL